MKNTHRAVFALAAFLGAGWLGITGSGADSHPAVDIGSRLELFVDDFLIDAMSGVRLQLHSPIAAGRALAFDRPWEGNTSWALSVFQDGGRYRMYYRGSSDPEYARRAGLRPGEVLVPAHPSYVCYAESRDGVTWTKSSLGLFEFNGSKDNNIVALGVPAMVPFLDANPAAPSSERYKMSSQREKAPGDAFSLRLLVSGDGIHWKEGRSEPFLTRPGAFDSHNVAFWSEKEACYAFYYRYGVQGVRSIVRSTTLDWRSWSDQTYLDFGKTPPEHLYTNATTPYFRAPHIYLAFPKRYMPWRQYFEDAPDAGISEGVFMTSRDGVRWNRFMEAFIRPGRDKRNWVHRTTGVSPGVVATAADEISIYASRHYTYPSAHVERFALRTDGFVSVHAEYSGGEFVSRPLLFRGDSLVLNYATSAAGSIRVEIQNADGQPLPGYLLDESPTLYGDETEATVRWSRRVSEPDPGQLSRLGSRPVRLRFVMKDADLYSIRFR